jgi:hypothetical protein
LCLRAQPDGPHELRVGGRVVLPGECIEAPEGARGGRLRAVLLTSGTEVARPRIGVRAGVRTEVRVDGDRVRVAERRRCDGRVEADDSPTS